MNDVYAQTINHSGPMKTDAEVARLVTVVKVVGTENRIIHY